MSAEVRVYGKIGREVLADKFIKDIEALNVAQLVVRINSPGGYISEGIAIYEALRRHPAHVVTVVDALAASAASYIFQAGDERVMSRYSELMIHEATLGVVGNAAELTAAAHRMDRESDIIARVYADRSRRGDASTWRAAMRAETWYTAAEAVDAGLADRIDNTTRAAATLDFDRSQFRFPGRQAAPGPAVLAGQSGSRFKRDPSGLAVKVAAARRNRTNRLTAVTKG